MTRPRCPRCPRCGLFGACPPTACRIPPHWPDIHAKVRAELADELPLVLQAAKEWRALHPRARGRRLWVTLRSEVVDDLGHAGWDFLNLCRFCPPGSPTLGRITRRSEVVLGEGTHWPDGQFPLVTEYDSQGEALAVLKTYTYYFDLHASHCALRWYAAQQDPPAANP